MFLEYSVESHYFVDFLHAKKRSWVICVIEWPISSCNLLLEDLYVAGVCPIELHLLRQAMLSGFLSIWHDVYYSSMDFILWMRLSVIFCFLQVSPISSGCSEGNLKHVMLDEASEDWQCLPYATFTSSITILFNNLRVCISLWLVFVWWTCLIQGERLGFIIDRDWG